jgi:hypothetical protein
MAKQRTTTNSNWRGWKNKSLKKEEPGEENNNNNNFTYKKQKKKVEKKKSVDLGEISGPTPREKEKKN